MLNFLLFRKKEVPAELQRTEKVFEGKINTAEDISDPNKFMLAEKDGLPYYIYIPINSLMISNNPFVCITNLEENFHLIPKILELGEISDSRMSISNLTRLIPKFSFWDKMKNFFSFEPVSVNNENISDEFTKQSKLNTKEIKIMKVNSVGTTVALVSRNNLITITNIEDKSKILIYSINRHNNIHYQTY